MIHGLGPKGRLSRRPSEWIFVAERQGRLRPPRRGGPSPGRRLWLFQNNTLNEILVFDLSLATGLYALTIYAGTFLGTLVVSAEAFVTSATERRAPDWTGTPALVLGRIGLLPAALGTCR